MANKAMGRKSSIKPRDQSLNEDDEYDYGGVNLDMFREQSEVVDFSPQKEAESVKKKRKKRKSRKSSPLSKSPQRSQRKDYVEDEEDPNQRMQVEDVSPGTKRRFERQRIMDSPVRIDDDQPNWKEMTFKNDSGLTSQHDGNSP